MCSSDIYDKLSYEVVLVNRLTSRKYNLAANEISKKL